MSGFAPGDVVVCVDAGPDPLSAVPHHHKLRKGGVYRVARAFLSRLGRPSVALCEVPLPPPMLGFAAHRFRKIDKSDEGFAAWMRSLRPIPAKNKGKVEA